MELKCLLSYLLLVTCVLILFGYLVWMFPFGLDVELSCQDYLCVMLSSLYIMFLVCKPYFIYHSYILAWFVKVSGSSAILMACVFAFKCNYKIKHILKRRSHVFFANHVLNIVLSSNTKKGEIESAFPSLFEFSCLLTTQ